MSIHVQHVTKRFQKFTAVNDVSFRVETGALAALLGPSGCGKSTLLRTIAGLETPDEGSVFLSEQETSSVSTRHRGVGFVFQHYALFKHMTVADNIAFGLRVRKTPEQQVRHRVDELLALVQLSGYEHRYPSQLSGGQRQRVAVARALAPNPKVLLLDEPFGALDTKVREELREWVRRLHEVAPVTTLFVTHDQHEALEVASTVLVMNKGRIEQEGTPLEIFDTPRTPFVAEFVGENNYIEARVTEEHRAPWGPFSFSVNGSPVGATMRIYFRPNDVEVHVAPTSRGPNIPATVTKVKFKGPMIELKLMIDAERQITAQVPKGLSFTRGFREGLPVFVGITAFHAFAKNGQ